jgi:hypothetical protein
MGTHPGHSRKQKSVPETLELRQPTNHPAQNSCRCAQVWAFKPKESCGRSNANAHARDVATQRLENAHAASFTVDVKSNQDAGRSKLIIAARHCKNFLTDDGLFPNFYQFPCRPPSLPLLCPTLPSPYGSSREFPRLSSRSVPVQLPQGLGSLALALRGSGGGGGGGIDWAADVGTF